jgi:ribonuclease HII
VNTVHAVFILQKEKFMSVDSMQIVDQIRTPLLEKIKVLRIDNEILIKRINNATLEIDRLDEALGKAMFALRNLVRQCPTSLTCDNVSHSKKHDHHGAEEECPPLCRYYKALYEAQELLGWNTTPI